MVFSNSYFVVPFVYEPDVGKVDEAPYALVHSKSRSVNKENSFFMLFLVFIKLLIKLVKYSFCCCALEMVARAGKMGNCLHRWFP